MNRFGDCVHKFGDEIMISGEKCRYIGISADKRLFWSETRGLLIGRTKEEDEEFEESLKVPSLGKQIRDIFKKPKI